MNIALIGYGKMGRLIETIAIKRGHTVVSIIDADNKEDFDSPAFASADVALEFTTPDAAEYNIRRAWKAGVKVVSGTTGWTSTLPLLIADLEQGGNSLFWASNFSLGVNIFWELNRRMAKMMKNFAQYNVSIEETHHTAKKDAPSGTAVTLAETIISELDSKNGWTLSPDRADDKIEITAFRLGDVFGIHTTHYESNEDIITLTHEAKSREGFALGAVVAAEFMHTRKGFYTMSDMLKL